MADDTGWPAAGHEPVAWEADREAPMSRRERMRSRGDYFASVPPQIAQRTPILPRAVEVAAADAVNEIARFDAKTSSFTVHFASILLRSESSASSEVEQLTASAKQVALARIGGSRSANAELVVANSLAMEAAIGLSERLDSGSVIEMHRALMGRHSPEIVGQFRDVPVWVGGRMPHMAAHVGPVPGRIAELMNDLMVFARRTDLQVLPQIAIAHAQFETIHPFPDGNGRTGRALVHSMLRAMGIVRHVTVPVSAGLLAEPVRYFDALTAYRDGDPVPIVEIFTESVFRSLGNAEVLVAEIGAARESWETRTTARRGSAARRALDVLIEQPVITVQHLASELNVSEVTAGGALTRLEDDGIIRRSNAGRRNRYWQADEVLGALDGFGARSRRARL